MQARRVPGPTGWARARAWACVAALAASTLVVPAAGAAPLRVCADPDNLPFTKSEGPERGLYIDLAELVAGKLGVAVEYTWYYTNNQRRALRNTVLVNACDAVFALPSDYRARGLQKTQAFLKVGYAVVSAPGFKFSGLDDLKGQRVAVLFSTTPHILLNSLDGYRTTTYRNTDEAFAALARGEVDAAFLWGPSAGYDNRKQHSDRWRVTAVSGLDMAGEMAVGVRADMEPLRKAIDQALLELRPQIVQLADKYAFPRQTMLELALPAPAAAQAQVPAAAAAVTPSPSPSTSVLAPTAAPAAATTADKPDAAVMAKAGRVRFNDQCSHCHGSDGYSPVRERDLRRLNLRYEAKWPDVALTAVREGRSDQGMPAWKALLKEQDIQELMAFLSTLQK